MGVCLGGCALRSLFPLHTGYLRPVGWTGCLVQARGDAARAVTSSAHAELVWCVVLKRNHAYVLRCTDQNRTCKQLS